jgi:hypothetical protein
MSYDKKGNFPGEQDITTQYQANSQFEHTSDTDAIFNGICVVV